MAGGAPAGCWVPTGGGGRGGPVSGASSLNDIPVPTIFAFPSGLPPFNGKVTAVTEIEPRLLSLARDADTEALIFLANRWPEVRLPYVVRYAGNSPRVSSPLWVNTVVGLLGRCSLCSRLCLSEIDCCALWFQLPLRRSYCVGSKPSTSLRGRLSVSELNPYRDWIRGAVLALQGGSLKGYARLKVAQ